MITHLARSFNARLALWEGSPDPDALDSHCRRDLPIPTRGDGYQVPEWEDGKTGKREDGKTRRREGGKAGRGEDGKEGRREGGKAGRWEGGKAGKTGRRGGLEGGKAGRREDGKTGFGSDGIFLRV